MNAILEKIQNDKLGVCQCEWCKDCPLSLAGHPNRKNIFSEIASELQMDDKTRYLILPCSFCAKEIEIHIDSKPKNWKRELDKLISEVSDMSFDESYDYIVERYTYQISELKELMKSRLEYFNEYKNKPKNTCGCHECK